MYWEIFLEGARGAFIQSKASWTEGAEWTPKFPADAGSVCGKAPMTACMPQGMTEVHHVVFICENVCTLPDDNQTNVKYEVILSQEWKT
jgi:hypothetical protein